MSESASRTPIPDPPASDAEICDELSSVRPKVSPTPTDDVVPAATRRRLQSGEWNASERLERSGRQEQLVRLAKVLLADLPADHARARLLRIAMVRRDEVLLEGLLFGDASRSSRLPPKP